MRKEQHGGSRPSTGQDRSRVLVVDDNRDFAENIAEVVEDLGHSCEVALTGQAALDRFVRQPFQVAVLDLQLPDVPGTRLIARFKEIDPDCACVVFTGNAALSNAVEALNRGAFAYLIKGGEVDEFRAVLGKALEAHRTSVELKQVQGINRAIMGNFPGRMMVLGSEGRVIIANEFPLPGFRSPGASLADLFPKGHPWSPTIFEAYQRCQATGRPTLPARLEAAGEEGGTRSFNVRFVPLFHSLAQHLVVIEEVTKLVELEAETQRSTRLAAVGEMAAMIAHEVRNPLSGISGAVQVLRKNLQAGHPGRQVCDEVISQVDRLNKTIEDLLLLARPMEPRLVETSLSDLIESTVSFLREDAGFKEIEVRIEPDAGDDRCPLDPFLFRQALTNVLINAAQAMAGRGRIAISLAGDKDRLRVNVEDTGPGLPADTSRLFEPFYTTKPAGTGLGLPITAKILEVHGGGISLRNLPAGGAGVTLVIPRRPGPRGTGRA